MSATGFGRSGSGSGMDGGGSDAGPGAGAGGDSEIRRAGMGGMGGEMPPGSTGGVTLGMYQPFMHRNREGGQGQ